MMLPNKKQLLILFMCNINTLSFAQPHIKIDFPEVALPFKAGEWFKFRIHYGFFNASYATLGLTKDTIKGKSVIRAKGYGTTTGLARWFFKVEDHYDSYFDEKKVIPYWFVRDINEGGYTKNLEIDFDHNQNLAHVNDKKNQKKESFKIAENAQDLISAFYYLRAFYPRDKLIINETFDINMFFDKENTNLNMFLNTT